MYLVSGGKTGGHIIPLINLCSNNKDFTYIGCSKYLEKKLCQKNNIKFIGYSYNKSRIKMILNGYKMIKEELKKKEVKGIIISGGLVSLPLALYSYNNKIPLYLIECNTTFGLVNKLFYSYSKNVFYNFNKIKDKGIITGIPLNINKEMFENKYDILIIGGSLGSKVLCDLGVKLAKKYNILLISGNYYNEYKDKVNTIKFSSNLYDLIKQSKLIISRGGGVTLKEVITINKPLICIPSRKTKNNHQVLNAKYLEDLGVLKYFCEDSEYNNILDYISNILSNDVIRQNMKEKQKKLINYSLNDFYKEIGYYVI